MTSLKATRRFSKATEDYFQGSVSTPVEPSPPPAEIADINTAVNAMLNRDIYTLVITNIDPNRQLEDLGVGEFVIHASSLGNDNYVISICDGPIPKEELEARAIKENYTGQAFFIKRLHSILQTTGFNSYVRDISQNPANSILVAVDHLKYQVNQKATDLKIFSEPAKDVPPPPKEVENPAENTESAALNTESPKESSVLPIIIGIVVACIVGGAIFFVVKSKFDENKEEE